MKDHTYNINKFVYQIANFSKDFVDFNETG